MNLLKGSEGMKHSKEIVIFSHIPKTAGTTIRKIMDEQYGKKNVIGHQKLTSIPQVKMDQVEAIYGHCRFGIHKEIFHPCTYITMLRDPVERVISTYYYAKRKEKNRMHQLANSRGFKEFIEEELMHRRAPLINHQTRFISGEKKPNLEKAIENIHEYYTVVGITELFDESIFLMKTFLGWHHLDYTKENVTVNRPKQHDLPQETIDLIKEYNQLDIELYNYSKNLLIENINALDSSLRKELQAFKNSRVIGEV